LIQTISELFYQSLERDYPDALAHRVDGHFRGISHRELQAQVERLALALEGHGLRPGDRIAILAENGPGWAVTDYACALSNVVTVPVYPTLSLVQTGFILRHSSARWVFCSTADQLAKVLELWPELPELEAAVLVGGDPPAAGGRQVHRWVDLMAEGAAQEPRRAEVKAKALAVQPGDLLTIIYTSGTTGDPKGAMLSHRNLVTNILQALKIVEIKPGQRCLSILPISHIFERMAGHYTMLYAGVSIYYAESLQTIPRDLLEARPDLLLAVPRIFEKFYSRVREQVTAKGLASRLVFHWVMRSARKLAEYRYRDQPLPLGGRIAQFICDALVFGKIRAHLGGRLKLAVCGGAAIHPRILEFFWAAGIPLHEGYGLTETSPLLTISPKGGIKPGCVGFPIYDQWDGRPFLKLAEDGEILCRGPNVMQGYWRNETATREVMDAEGYFHTGDIGEMDTDGRVRITDRKKEILVTSGGKNVAPLALENALRGDKYIEQAVVLGDGRNFISALVVPNFPALRRWAERKQLPFESDRDLVGRPETLAKVMSRVDRINAGFSNFERIRKIVLLDGELTPENGLLTPSHKVRRRIVAKTFAVQIDALYKEEAD
jgi:long-chain acyl-CoA synthetase